VCAAYFVPLLGYVVHGRHRDFTDAWYTAAGAIIVCTTFFLAVFIPLGLWAQALWTQSARRFVRRPLRQAALDAACVLPRFRLAERYGVLVAVIFTGLLVAPGCPYVYPVLQFYALVATRVDRHVLLRLSSVPDPLSSVLAERVSTLLPLSVWLHLAVGTWMLGTQTVPNYLMSWVADPAAEMADYENVDRFSLQHRLSRMNGLIFFVVFLVFTVWVAPLTFWLRNAACCCGDPEPPRSATALAGGDGGATGAPAPTGVLKGTWTSVMAVVMRTRRGPGMDFSYAFRKKCLHGLPSYRIVRALVRRAAH
jgi:hypothetical protein